jgi:hypothetical protein
MQRAIKALGSGDVTEAGRVLNALVQEWPAWSEAWNKRATLRFIEGRDVDSLDDIGQTLLLEPRHFGAVSGFAQICIRAGDLTAALTAFEHVLNINPNQEGARRAVEVLRRQAPQTLHGRGDKWAAGGYAPASRSGSPSSRVIPARFTDRWFVATVRAYCGRSTDRSSAGGDRTTCAVPRSDSTRRWCDTSGRSRVDATRVRVDRSAGNAGDPPHLNRGRTYA